MHVGLKSLPHLYMSVPLLFLQAWSNNEFTGTWHAAGLFVSWLTRKSAQGFHGLTTLRKWACKMTQILQCDWLPKREESVGLSCTLGIAFCVPQGNRYRRQPMVGILLSTLSHYFRLKFCTVSPCTPNAHSHIIVKEKITICWREIAQQPIVPYAYEQSAEIAKQKNFASCFMS